jgi:TIR domain-containing protein
MALARRQSARNSETPKLHVFISYATEDANLAQAINLELKTVFTQLIKTTLDSNIKLGVKWAPELEEALSRADVLLIISTGRQKPSHSYTGFEVGFFRASMLAKPTMTYIDIQQRLIIPIGVEKIPDTVSDIEGLNLAADMRPLMGPDRQRFLQSLQSDTAGNPFMKLFTRLKGLVEKFHEFDDTEMGILLSKAKESATRLYTIFFEGFQNRIYSETFPERKIVVHLPANARIEPMGELPPETQLEFIGRDFAIFNINPPPGRISWADFIQQVSRGDTTTAWTDIIKSQAVMAQRGEFGENRRLLASSDRERFFRMFISRSALLYSGVTELHIDVVEVKARNYGDKTTTMLLKAINVGLMYRSLFLEGKSSDFSPERIRATLPRDVPAATSELLQELDYVLWQSTEAELAKPENILLIWPPQQRGELAGRLREWEKVKSDLEASARKVLRAADDQELELATNNFEDCLASFCSVTAPMNKEFLGRVLGLLDGIVRPPVRRDGTSPSGLQLAGVSALPDHPPRNS